MVVTNPWNGVRTFYWGTKNGLRGAVGEHLRGRHEWDWHIEIFLGTIWHDTQDFEKFVEMLSEVWLHEYLHMIINWERVYSGEEYEDDERAVVSLVELLNKPVEVVVDGSHQLLSF